MSIKRLCLSALAAACICFAGFGVAKADNAIAVIVNGTVLSQSGVMLNGNTLVPMRAIFEALGAEVKYEAATKTIRANRDKTDIVLTIGSNSAFVNTERKTLAAPPVSINGSTMVPLRFIGEALGADVKWDGATKTVNVTNKDEDLISADVKIESVTFTPNKALKTGDTLTVEINGEPACKANFDIEDVKTGMPMHEESAGRYIGTLAISSELSARDAAVIGHLKKDDKEGIRKASGKVSINYSNAATIKVSPAKGTSVSETRPAISVVFSNEITKGAIQLTVDNNNVTEDLNVSKNSISYQPTADLSAGKHTCKVTGTDNEGKKINTTWTFTVKNNAVTSTPFIELTSPKGGSSVGTSFNISGKTNSKATVTLNIKEEYAEVLGIISVKGRNFTKTLTADEKGVFSIDFDASAIRAGNKITIEFSAKTTKGEETGVSSIQVKRQ